MLSRAPLLLVIQREHLDDAVELVGLGFGLRTAQHTGYEELESEGQFGWDGALYTRFWVDPKQDMFGIFLSQMENYWDENLIGKYRVLVNQAVVGK